jgi:transposase
VRAYLLKESFQLFWNYKSAYWAEWYLDKWCARAMRSRLDPIKAFVKTIRRHQPLILNWFKAKNQFSSGVVEGLNRKVNLVTRKSYGFRSYEVLKIALFHTTGDLPEPALKHKFH